jgi:membrane carboxypeptidase/penicillin-binding protein PbpC
MKKIFWIIFGILAVSFFAYCFFPIFTYSPENDNFPGHILITDRNGDIIIDKAKIWWYKKQWTIDLDSQFVENLVSIEDKNFYSHFWVDIVSKIWALKSNIFSGKIVSWWSTITEQMIKNKYFIWKKRSYLQKAREATIALFFSAFYSKDEILSQYLENIYLWKNNYWVSSAIEVYFDKESIHELTNQEQVILLSLIKYPSISSTQEYHFKKYATKIREKLWYSYEEKIYLLPSKSNIELLPWAKNYPTIDTTLQKYAKDILNNTLDELSHKNVTNWAIFALNPQTNEVLIYQWSREFYSQTIQGEFDVLQSRRQMWSTLKPFIYAYAIEKWAGSESLLVDIDTQYESFQDEKSYTSSNYNHKNYGYIRLKKALWNSLNNASVRLVKELWLFQSFDFYKQNWFDFVEHAQHYWYSFVLWSPDISLINLVKSYKNLIPWWETNNISEETKFLLYDILSDPDNRDLSFWVHSILNTSIPMAVKTGTSSNFRDNVVISYHPDLIIWVWVWNNDNSSMIWVTWITWAGYIWHQIAEKAIELWYITQQEIPKPDGVSDAKYCLDIKCFRRENIYVTDKKSQYFSAIADEIYDPKDVFINISEEEEKILEEMGFKKKK